MRDALGSVTKSIAHKVRSYKKERRLPVGRALCAMLLGRDSGWEALAKSALSPQPSPPPSGGEGAKACRAVGTFVVSRRSFVAPRRVKTHRGADPRRRRRSIGPRERLEQPLPRHRARHRLGHQRRRRRLHHHLRHPPCRRNRHLEHHRAGTTGRHIRRRPPRRRPRQRTRPRACLRVGRGGQCRRGMTLGHRRKRRGRCRVACCRCASWNRGRSGEKQHSGQNHGTGAGKAESRRDASFQRRPEALVIWSSSNFMSLKGQGTGCRPVPA